MTTPVNAETVPQQRPLSIPGQAVQITEPGPVVIIGPNGSGKTRRSREIGSDDQVELISALRNTRLSPQLTVAPGNQAKSNFIQARDYARNQPYEMSNDFDSMLGALIGESLGPALKFLKEYRADEHAALPPLSPLERVQAIWSEFFPGRELDFDQYEPRVKNLLPDGNQWVTYSAYEMSDGEKAALYLAGRVFSADERAVIVVDEPETHFHSLLAVRFWDAIERARPDLRIVYVTHDMSFASSRRAIRYLLANPATGLSPIELGDANADLAEVLLGAASLSFYAKKIIFCEGETESLDYRFYRAWFENRETVVQSVGSCEQVTRSVATLASSGLVQNLTTAGVIDRDFHPEDYFEGLGAGIHPLPVHEIETLFALPGVVEAVCKHIGKDFDQQAYAEKIRSSYSESDRHSVVIERWKQRTERSLARIVSEIRAKDADLDAIVAQMPTLFDQESWNPSPKDVLEDEKARIESTADVGQPLDLVLKLMPGKKLKPLGPSAAEMKPSAYEDLVIAALQSERQELEALGKALRAALKDYLPEI